MLCRSLILELHDSPQVTAANIYPGEQSWGGEYDAFLAVSQFDSATESAEQHTALSSSVRTAAPPRSMQKRAESRK